MDAFDVIVGGGGYAGLTAVDRLARRGTIGRILLVDGKRQFVERIRLHEVAAGHKRRIFDYEPHLGVLGVAFIQGSVEDLHPSTSTLRITTADGRDVELGYRQLILALGSRTDVSRVPGARDHAVRLDSVEELGGLSKWAENAEGPLLVVGGGLTSFEAAAEFAESFPKLDVTLVSAGSLSAGDAPGGYDGEAIQHLRRSFERLKVRFLERSPVVGLEAGRAVLANGQAIEFGRCIWAGGFAASDLPKRAGMKVNAGGRIVCEPTLQSVSHPQIVAAGDIAEVIAEPGGLCRMSCAAGRPMGEAAAATAAALLRGATAPAFRFGYTFRCLSLGRHDGLIQFVDLMDRPRREFWTGERAARWKEYVCRRTVAGVGLTADVLPPDTPPVPLNSQEAVAIFDHGR